MAYQRKTRDRWDIETNYGYGDGWEVECSEYDWHMAKTNYRLYRENCPGLAVRMKKRREPIAQAGAPAAD